MARRAENPVKVSIRKAKRSDLDEIARIERESFSDPWSKEQFRDLVVNPRVIFLVAENPAAGHLLGYVAVTSVMDESEVINIAVDGTARRGSIGGSLLDSALAKAVARGAATTFLEVRESNDAARKLYETRGFAEVSRRRKYYTSPVEDAIVLYRAVK